MGGNANGDGKSTGPLIPEDISAMCDAAGQIMAEVKTTAKGIEDAASGTGKPIDAKGGLDIGVAALGGAGQIASAANASNEVKTAIAIARTATTVISKFYEAGDAVIKAASALVEAHTPDQHIAEFEFRCEGQDEADWQIQTLSFEEELNTPYRAQVDLVSTDVAAKAEDLLGLDCTLKIRRGADHSRTIHGIITKVHRGERVEHQVKTTVEVVPALALLHQVHDSRIFQNLDVLEILDGVLGTSLAAYQREVRIDASSSYPIREYCVQYDETVLDFVNRLCEDEGLTYYFDQTGEKEVMVIADDGVGSEATLLLTTAEFVPYVAHRGGDIGRAEPVYEFTRIDRLAPTSLTLRDFDWTTRELPFSKDESTDDPQGRSREQYFHRRSTHVGGYDTGSLRYGKHDIDKRLARGRQMQALEGFTYRGEGAVIGFRVGTRFTLSGHPHASLDGDYVIVSVVHHGRHGRPGQNAEASGDSGERYWNEFTCIPLDVPFRPRFRTPLPRVPGIETAIVVGQGTEEIWTDEHGRIRVQFHWDRVGSENERSSCWVRVMQSWAGAGFGTMFIPRVGMEVVVSFLGGDPDRPLVTGSVYNARNIPPIGLPDHKTQSVLRTESSPGRNGYNELRFEDLAGSELVSIHAQKDFAEVVEHDHSTRVKRNQSNTVGGNQTERVGGDQKMTIEGDREANIDGDETILIKGNLTHTVEKNRNDTVLEAEQLSVGSWQKHYVDGRSDLEYNGGREVVVRTFDNTHVEANKNTVVTQQYNIQADGHFKVIQGSETLYLHNEVFIESSSRVQVKSPSARVVLDGANASVLAQGLITLESGACKIEIGNGKIAITAPTIELNGGGSEVKLASSGAEVKGTTTASLTSQGMTTIMGTVVSIN